jgi:hypothetical protein
MLGQIISGVVIAIVSFTLGYLLFVVQRKEGIRLELFKRRLDSYDKIMKFMQKVDQEIVSKQFKISEDHIHDYLMEIYNLTTPYMHYLSEEVYYMLEMELAELILDLPNSGADFEDQCEIIKLQIIKEVSSYIISPKNIEKIVGRQTKRWKQFGVNVRINESLISK